MDLSVFENCLFVPAGNSHGTLYQLERFDRFEKNGFVLLPYQNPKVQKPNPEFFKIKKTEELDLSTYLIQEPALIKLKSATSKGVYLDKINQLKAQIQRGNIYEINYCIRFFSENVSLDPFGTFLKLNALAKAPYSAFLKIGDNYILSASPELFLKKEGDTIFTKPIKGTTRRGKDPQEDALLKEQLYTSIKERTENVMAVDVARNDLSMFAKKGSVQVNKLYNIESFETVHQMVSTVKCEIKENISFEKIIDSTFPMASMTGAPKGRSMQLIDEFEDFKRNYYSGAMGLIDEKGNYMLSVIIRSIFYDQKAKNVSIAVGGAITYLSDPEKEYEECLLKAKAMLSVLNAEII